MTRSVLLLSGGLESTALAYMLRPEAALVIDYGQRPAEGEVVAARAVATAIGISIEAIRFDLSELGSGLMAGSPSSAAAPSPEWWPYRNQLLATVASAWAVPRGFGAVMFGTVLGDAFHADGRPEFFRAIDELVSMQEGSIRVTAPAIALSTEQLLRKSRVPLSILGWTHSCHRASFACGDCPGCNKRRAALSALGKMP